LDVVVMRKSVGVIEGREHNAKDVHKSMPGVWRPGMEDEAFVWLRGAMHSSHKHIPHCNRYDTSTYVLLLLKIMYRHRCCHHCRICAELSNQQKWASKCKVVTLHSSSPRLTYEPLCDQQMPFNGPLWPMKVVPSPWHRDKGRCRLRAV
jgi:hypothetical protein